MLALTISAIGPVRSAPARRLLTRQAAPKAASAPTNARFYGVARKSTGVVAKRILLIVGEAEHPRREDSAARHRRVSSYLLLSERHGPGHEHCYVLVGQRVGKERVN